MTTAAAAAAAAAAAQAAAVASFLSATAPSFGPAASWFTTPAVFGAPPVFGTPWTTSLSGWPPFGSAARTATAQPSPWQPPTAAPPAASPPPPPPPPPPVAADDDEDDGPLELLDSDSDAPQPATERAGTEPGAASPRGVAAFDDDVVEVAVEALDPQQCARWEEARLRRQEERRLQRAARARAAAASAAASAAAAVGAASGGTSRPAHFDGAQVHAGIHNAAWKQAAETWRTRNMPTAQRASAPTDASDARAAQEEPSRPQAAHAPRRKRAAKHPTGPLAAEKPQSADAHTPPRADCFSGEEAAHWTAFTEAPHEAAPPLVPAAAAAAQAAEDAALAAEQHAERLELLAREASERAHQLREVCVNRGDQEAAAGATPPTADAGSGAGMSDPDAVLDRNAARGALGVAADAAEWAARAIEFEKQRKLAQLEKARRRADAARAAELAQRQAARVAELRASSAAQSGAADAREELRARVRGTLAGLTGHCASLGAVLAALGVPPRGWPLSGPDEVATAFRQAALRFHPDRAKTGGDPTLATYAEEAFKLIAKTKQERGVS